MKFGYVSGVIFILCITSVSYTQNITRKDYTYSVINSTELKAYVFTSEKYLKEKHNPAIVIFFGDGWSGGDASWSFGRAEHFAEMGLVAIAAEYRLSNKKDITPLDAMEDARDIIMWCRLKKDHLRIDSSKLAGYGWSAGGHLVVSAAIFDEHESQVSSSPNALVLISPAVSLEKDGRFKELLLNKIEVSNVSPDENVRKGLPPTLILQGKDDIVTPLTGAENFTYKMQKEGNFCELIVYDGVGHLLIPADKQYDLHSEPDPNVQADAFKKVDYFLRLLGYID